MTLYKVYKGDYWVAFCVLDSRSWVLLSCLGGVGIGFAGARAELEGDVPVPCRGGLEALSAVAVL